MTLEQLIGQTVNGCQVVAEIARGGMATVYRAHQISMDRPVVLKAMPPQFLHDETFRERFRQEASIAARLEHRAIVPVHDYGEWQGIPFIIMRYMEGGSLDERIAAGTLTLVAIQQIIRQVGSALDYAHSQGVLHRDLKPSNILLDRNDDAYITDFGIARLLSNNKNLTSTGVVGTPAYMSPEQAQGLPLDGRSDIYALGVVLFEALTGQHPFSAETPYSIAVMHVTTPPPSPRQFKPDLPPGIEAVVMKALAKDRTARYQTATELAGALDDADLIAAGEVNHTFQHVATPAEHHRAPTPRRPSEAVAVPLPAISGTSGLLNTSGLSGTSGTSHLYQKQTSRFRPLTYLVIATLVAFVAAAIILVGYVFFYNDSQAEPYDFIATGVARLTATAAYPTVQSLPGHILFAAEREGQIDLYLLSLSDGNEIRLTNNSGAEAYPAISPDGERFAYIYDPDGDFENGINDQTEIYISAFNSGGSPRQLTDNRLEVRDLLWTAMDTLIYSRLNPETGEFQLIEHNLSREDVTILQENAFSPILSPDNTQLIFTVGSFNAPESWELHVMNRTTGVITQLTHNNQPDMAVAWHPSGERFAAIRDTALVEILDSDTEIQLYAGISMNAHPSYSPDGNYLVFSASDSSGLLVLQRQDLQIQPLTTSGGQQPLWLP